MHRSWKPAVRKGSRVRIPVSPPLENNRFLSGKFFILWKGFESEWCAARKMPWMAFWEWREAGRGRRSDRIPVSPPLKNNSFPRGKFFYWFLDSSACEIFFRLWFISLRLVVIESTPMIKNASPSKMMISIYWATRLIPWVASIGENKSLKLYHKNFTFAKNGLFYIICPL